MPSEFPYMMSVTNVPAILAKIKSAGSPPKFTHEFLKTSLGFSSSNDRNIIKVLRALGFLTADGVPTSRYNDFRHEQRSGQILAEGLREGWADLFLASQKANELSTTELTGMFKSLTGKGEAVALKMASTFNAFAKQADWSPGSGERRRDEQPDEGAGDDLPKGEDDAPPPPPPTLSDSSGGLRLHHDIHIHLPPTSDTSVYTAIFRALREELLD